MTNESQEQTGGGLAAAPGSADGPARAWRFIEKMCGEAKTAEKMTDLELANALIAKVWAKYDMHSEESALIAAAIDRLQGVNVSPPNAGAEAQPPANQER